MKLWIAGGSSLALVGALTFLGGQASEQPVGWFYIYILLLAALMVLVGKGSRWARWIVSPALLFFAAASMLAGGALGAAFSLVFITASIVFFLHRVPLDQGAV